MLKQCAPALLLVFLCGCFQVKDELTIQPDGSGTIRLETQSSFPSEMAEDYFSSGDAGKVSYPPNTAREARAFFPAKDFTVNVKEKPGKDGGTSVVIEAAFKDINALLASPYGRAHGLTLKIDNGVLSLKAISGLEGPARMTDIKDDKGELSMGMPNLAEMRKKTNEMRFEFRVTMPNAVTAANGSREGKTASWTVERAKAKNLEEYARQLSTVMEASCPADSLKMTPVTPTRLDMGNFSELKDGSIGELVATPDPKKVEQAVRFVPHALHVTRTLDLSGEGGSSRENSAELVGELIVSNQFVPQKWGEAKVEEAVDVKGNNLKTEDSERSFDHYGYRGMSEDGSDSDENAVPKEQKRSIRLQFQPPDWKIKEIAKIKASIDLHYFGSSHVFKLSNAIPASWIVEQKGMDNMDSSQKAISDPKLSEAGINLQLQMGMVQNGVTILGLGVVSDNSSLTEVQVFDATGRPWPTFLQGSEMGEGGSSQVIIPGRPQAPLSLALVVSGGGTNITVPILLEHVPVTGK